MAINDIDVLRKRLPELFEPRKVIPNWEEGWHIVPVDQPEAAEDPLVVPDPGEIQLDSDATGVDAGLVNAPRSRLPVEPDGTFPGAPVNYARSDPPPPPDAFAFYLPFHYFHPEWWGIYIVADRAEELATYVNEKGSGALTMTECRVAVRVFLYGHEAFHHAVESLATRLEITHRRPLYRTGFQRLYERTRGTDDCVEEALASAHGLDRMRSRVFRGETLKATLAQAILLEWLDGCPPGYRRAREFIQPKTFKKAKSAFAEQNHAEAVSGRAVSADVWMSFPHAFGGISRINSRVNYLVARHSALARRARLEARYLSYRDIRRKLESLGECRRVRDGKGSHEIWSRRDGKTFSVPRHVGDMPTGTLASIIRQAGLDMSVSQFIAARP